jgi:hypothetical protein
VAGGVSSFCAEANARGIRVTSFDRIYSLPAEQIAERSEPDLESVYRTIGSVPTYRWSYYETPERMREFLFVYVFNGSQQRIGQPNSTMF